MAPLLTIIGQLDDAASLPLYQQLQRGLRQAIESKLLAPDDALPPERDLAEEFAVSRITVRKAIDGLVSEGLLTRKQGSGTFVSGRVEKNFSKLTSFTEDMIARGRTPKSTWLRKSQGTVTPEESLTMGLSPGTPVYRFNRLRFADDAPMALEFCTVPAFCLPSVEAVESSLYTTRWRKPAIARRARCSAYAQCCSPVSRPSSWARMSATRGCWSSAAASCRTAARWSSRNPSIAATLTISSPS